MGNARYGKPQKLTLAEYERCSLALCQFLKYIEDSEQHVRHTQTLINVNNWARYYATVQANRNNTVAQVLHNPTRLSYADWVRTRAALVHYLAITPLDPVRRVEYQHTHAHVHALICYEEFKFAVRKVEQAKANVESCMSDSEAAKCD